MVFLGLFFSCNWHIHVIVFLFRGWVRLGPLGMSAINYPVVPALDETDKYETFGGMVGIVRGNQRTEKTCPSATLYTTDPT